MTRAPQMNEDELIAELLKQVPLASGASGPGDDCAVLERGGGPLQLLKTDAMVEGVHWSADASPERVGRKAIARVISDFAAMGGRPKEFMITLAMPKSTASTWCTALYQGMGECLKTYGGVIVGGETSSSPEGSPIVISVAATGEVRRDHLVLRSQGQTEDAILVTGELGGSIAGKHLDFTPRVDEADWLVSHFKPRAMMDLSDGLAKDLPRLAKASKCGFTLAHQAIPCSESCSIEQAMTDGEDYELLFTMEAGLVDSLLEAWHQKFPKLAVSTIGKLCAENEGDQLKGGWDHFS